MDEFDGLINELIQDIDEFLKSLEARKLYAKNIIDQIDTNELNQQIEILKKEEIENLNIDCFSKAIYSINDIYKLSESLSQFNNATFDLFKDKIKQLKGKYSETEKRIGELSDQVEVLQQEKNNTIIENNDLLNKLRVYDPKLKPDKKDRETEKILSENKSLHQKYLIEEQHHKKWENLYNNLNKEHGSLVKKYRKLEDGCAALKQKVIKKKNKNKKFKTEKYNLDQKIAELNKKINELTKSNTKLSKQVKSSNKGNLTSNPSYSEFPESIAEVDGFDVIGQRSSRGSLSRSSRQEKSSNDEIQSLKQENLELKRNLEEKKKQMLILSQSQNVSNLNKEINDLKNLVQLYKNSATEKNKQNHELDVQMVNLRSQFNQELHNKQKECQSIISQKEEIINRLNKDVQNYIAKINGYEKQIANYKEKNGSNIASLKQYYEKQILSLQKDNEKSISSLKQDYENQILSMQKDYEKQILSMQKDNEKSISSLKQDYEKKILSLQKDSEKSISSLKQDYEKRIISLQKDSEKLISSLQKDLGNQITELASKNEMLQKAVNNKSKESIENESLNFIGQEQEKLIIKLEEESQNNRNEIEKLSKEKQDLEQKYSELESTNEAQTKRIAEITNENKNLKDEVENSKKNEAKLQKENKFQKEIINKQMLLAKIETEQQINYIRKMQDDEIKSIIDFFTQP